MHESHPDNISPIETPWERRVEISSELGRVLQDRHEALQEPLIGATPHGPADPEAAARLLAIELRFNDLVAGITEINPQVPRHSHWIPNGNGSPWRETGREPAPLHTFSNTPTASPHENPEIEPQQEDFSAAEDAVGL